MNRVPVSSSNIKSIGYDNGTLEIEFNAGAVYQYSDVDVITFNNLMEADSVGSFFTQNIKHNFQSKKIE